MKIPVVLALFALAYGFNNNVQADSNCNPNILFDATLTFVGDAIVPESEVSGPLSPEALAYLLDYCSDFYRTEYGLHTKNWWTGKGKPPKEIVAEGYSSSVYRLYGMATPEYPNNFPMTNGKVIDDAMAVIFLSNYTLGGAWAQMQKEMGMEPMVMAGEWIVCGGYRGFQNDTNGVTKPLWPNIKYNSMPMMSMWMGATGDFANADSPVNCNLESDWWGAGSAIGLASIRTTSAGIMTANLRNVLSFPPSTPMRTNPPRYRHCRNTNV